MGIMDYSIFGGPQPTKPSPGPDWIWDGKKWVKKKTAAPAPIMKNPYDKPYDQATADLIASIRQGNPEADQLWGQISGGPDYSSVPGWSVEDVDKASKEYAQNTADWAAAPLKQQLENAKALYAFSAEQGNRFGQAIAMVFSGGKANEAEAQQYAEQTFGSKYAIAAAVQMIGYELMAKMASSFSETHMRIADRIADIYSQMPEVMADRQNYLMGVIKEARSEAQLTWSNKVELYGILKNKLGENQQNLSNIRDLYAQQREDWATAHGQKELTPSDLIEQDDGFYIMKQQPNGKVKLVKVADKAKTSDGLDSEGVQALFGTASQIYYDHIDLDNMTPQQALRATRQELLNRAKAERKTLGNTEVANQLTKFANNFVPGGRTEAPPEPAETFSYEPDNKGNVWEINNATGERSVVLKAPSPSSKTPPAPRNIGGYIWKYSPEKGWFNTGQRSKTSQSPPDAGDQPTVSEIRHDVFARAETLANAMVASTDALKAAQGIKEHRYTAQQVFNLLYNEFSDDLKAAGMGEKDINALITSALAGRF
jgi:hypothetical protein